MADFKHGDPVRIHRPSKKDHGDRARFVETSQDPAMAWVAFHKEGRARLPALADIKNPSRVTRKLYPLSHLQPDER